MKLPQVSLTCDVHCVTGWTLLDSVWQGVSLQAVMNLVKVKRDANFVIFEAPADYSSSIPIKDVQKGNIIMAYGFSGQALPKAFGAPLRSLVPDRYFYKSVKWAERIKFTVEDEPGYYETRGYSNSADPWKEDRYSDR